MYFVTHVRLSKACVPICPEWNEMKWCHVPIHITRIFFILSRIYSFSSILLMLHVYPESIWCLPAWIHAPLCPPSLLCYWEALCSELCHVTMYMYMCPSCTLFWQALGSFSTGLMDIEDLKDIECHSIPGAGACGKANKKFLEIKFNWEWN